MTQNTPHARQGPSPIADDLFTFIGKALSAREPARLAAAKEIYTALQHAEEHRNAYDFDTDTYKVHEIERRLLSAALSLLARDYRWGAFINRANAKDIGGDLKATTASKTS